MKKTDPLAKEQENRQGRFHDFVKGVLEFFIPTGRLCLSKRNELLK